MKQITLYGVRMARRTVDPSHQEAIIAKRGRSIEKQNEEAK